MRRVDKEIKAAQVKLAQDIQACFFLYFHTCFPQASCQAIHELAAICCEQVDDALADTMVELTPILINKPKLN